MELDIIQTFCQVAELKSFAKAAKKLGLSTPVVTRHVAKLEHDLQTKLLQRTTRHVTLTESGHLFYEKAKDLLLLWKTSAEQIKTLKQGVSGILKIGAPISISYLFLTEHLPKFMHKYPELTVQIVNGNHLLDLLRNDYDLVIHCGQLPDSTYHSRFLGNWEKITCASPVYLKKHGIPKKPEELKHHNCLDHYDNFHSTWQFQVQNKRIDLPISGNLKSNSSIDLMNLASHDMGIVYLPSFTVKKEIDNKKLQPILSEYRPPSLPIYAVYPSKDYINQKLKLFLDFLQEINFS